MDAHSFFGLMGVLNIGILDRWWQATTHLPNGTLTWSLTCVCVANETKKNLNLNFCADNIDIQARIQAITK